MKYFEIASHEYKAMQSASKIGNYYNSDFYTDYPRKSVVLPMGRTIENTLVFDNWISKTVNRYASASAGKNASVELSDSGIQLALEEWHDSISFGSKLTSIARYQGLYGFSVVKLILRHARDEEGLVNVAGKSTEDILKDVDIAVFGADTSFVRHDEYGNIDSICILVGDRLEVFTNNAIEVYKLNGSRYRLVKTDANPLAPYPMAFVVNNLLTGSTTSSDVAGIVTLQESLNDALTSLRLVNHYHGFPIYTATGVQIAYDESGNTKPLIMGAGMTLQSESDSTKFGRVEMPAITPLKESIEALTKEIAISTNSLSLLTGQIPSGTALGYMLSDFNSAVSEKQLHLKSFMLSFHRTILKLIEYMLGQKTSDIKIKAYVSGHNSLADNTAHAEALELFTAGALSLQTLLDNSDCIDSTSEELSRIAKEKAANPNASISSLLGV
ncbi:phage portal protein [Deinococcus aquaticus]|uniref:Phage portal protein n=1 Tax=Deinococcus aquaticus TaxID=328692 RepID=A0ABY7UZ05_9DEIO|nr:phage portal protein [Deinococcus aquaticus]WDA58158.1 phage portal protein [Deinococcus aquaticus]